MKRKNINLSQLNKNVSLITSSKIQNSIFHIPKKITFIRNKYRNLLLQTPRKGNVSNSFDSSSEIISFPKYIESNLSKRINKRQYNSKNLSKFKKKNLSPPNNSNFNLNCSLSSNSNSNNNYFSERNSRRIVFPKCFKSKVNSISKNQNKGLFNFKKSNLNNFIYKRRSIQNENIEKMKLNEDNSISNQISCKNRNIKRLGYRRLSDIMCPKNKTVDQKKIKKSLITSYKVINFIDRSREMTKTSEKKKREKLELNSNSYFLNTIDSSGIANPPQTFPIVPEFSFKTNNTNSVTTNSKVESKKVEILNIEQYTQKDNNNVEKNPSVQKEMEEIKEESKSEKSVSLSDSYLKSVAVETLVPSSQNQTNNNQQINNFQDIPFILGRPKNPGMKELNDKVY